MTSIVSWQSTAPEQLLTERFHLSNGFHPGQREIIEQLAQGKRVLAIQRTGWGKSLCYQMASLYYPHLTIVFSPLKALMRDQCQRCNTAYDIPAAIVSSDFISSDNETTLQKAVAGRYKILFIAPERLSNALWQTYITQMRINMIVIDEAHCISTWGHDFRPDYRRIIRLVNALPKNMPVLALTASANKHVEEDILQQMSVGVQVVRGTMQRPNLHLQVVRVNGDQDKLGYLAEILPYFPGTGIIYTATKHDAEMVATFLQHEDIAAEYYHANRDDAARQEIEQGLMANRYKVVCSTNALGMGIDKPDIRFVIHYQLPASPIHYYQEMGRAGRDGKVSWCILLYDPADLEIQRYFIQSAKPEKRYYEQVLALLRQSPQGQRERDIMLITGLANTPLRNILADLQEQGLIEHLAQRHIYRAINAQSQIDYTAHDAIRAQKEQALSALQHYIEADGCYMEFLTTHLGDEPGYQCRTCGYCQPTNFPVVKPSFRIQILTGRFLEEEFLPVIEKRSSRNQPIHEAGWALGYHSKSKFGKLVKVSKYDNGGPFALLLINRSVEVIKSRYPIGVIDGIVSVPPTKSGLLVETFARQVANQLGIEYIDVLAKVRPTREQKDFTNWRQKSENVKGAFTVRSPHLIAGRVLLLIDDIYDSGWMLREIGQTLMLSGTQAIYPFTITKTAHSDDQ